MKGEYLDQHQHQQQHHHHHQHQNLPPIFSKLHHHHPAQPQPQPQPQSQPQPQHQQLLPFSHHFHLPRDAAEEDDTRSTGAAATATPSSAKPHDNNPNTSAGTDGATIEVIRRPRGRPPGSKNKPKPPVIITRDPEPAMNPYILEVPGGSDVVESIARFCRRKNTGICVLTGSGTVANVTLRQPSTTPGATITFHGTFGILSVSATFLPQTTSYPVPNTFTISLAGPQGQIVGGIVAGSLVAAGTVYIIAASFNNPSYHRLPVEEEGRNSGSGGGTDGQGQSPAVSGGGGESGQHAPEGQSPAMYSVHMPSSDVIWAPTPRPPPPY